MAASSNSKYPALASAVDPSSLLIFSGQTGSIEEQIEQSKAHWSQVTEVSSDEKGPRDVETSNVDVFKDLQSHPTWGTFFKTFSHGKNPHPTCGTFFKTFGHGKNSGGELVMGEKFAEGGQAELYNVQVYWRKRILRNFAEKHGSEYVLKAFKRGYFLRDLKSQWPEGMLKFHAEKYKTRHLGTKHHGPRYFCDVVCGTLLEDGRFAFVMVKEKGDLHTTIDNIMRCKDGVNSGPFAKAVAKRIMYAIAQGMASLHERNIIHRDLKAANVLITKNSNFIVADFESSIGVEGTGFFRAPEILQACQNGDVSKRHDLFTKKADVYAYGMTCYEILTGKLPFEGYSKRDFNHVLEGQRPIVPEYVDDWACKLLCMRWQPNPLTRPSFDEILKLLKSAAGEGEVILDWPSESEVILFPVEEVGKKQRDVLAWWRRCLGSCIATCSELTLPRRRPCCFEVDERQLPAFPGDIFPVEEVGKNQRDVLAWWRRCLGSCIAPCSGLTLPRPRPCCFEVDERQFPAFPGDMFPVDEVTRKKQRDVLVWWRCLGSCIAPCSGLTLPRPHRFERHHIAAHYPHFDWESEE